MKKHYKSVFENEQELLKAIIDIHLGGNKIELDPMFFKGNFYKNGIERPDYYYDNNYKICGSAEKGELDKPTEADATNLHWFKDGKFNNIILDPPFLFGIHGKTKDYYSSQTHTIFRNFLELEILYKGILKEAYRLLKKGGILIFKCQDYTDSKTTMTHVLVYNWAVEQGFYAKDVAILVKSNKITNPNTKQRHLRKIHTYFWLFQK
jgi:hypothetical protein